MPIPAPRASFSPFWDQWKAGYLHRASSFPLLSKHRQDTNHKSASGTLLGEEEIAAAFPAQLPGASSANLEKAGFKEEIYGFMQ